MTKTDFLTQLAKASQTQWEEAAVRAAASGEVVDFPMVEVVLSPFMGHTGSVFVSSDVFSVGTFDDFLRLPLGPLAAQRVADLLGKSLTTRKISKDTWNASNRRLAPQPSTAFGQVNRGPNLAQYATHDRQVQGQLDAVEGYAFGDLVTGHKKDVVISNAQQPGHVVIYGWQQLNGTPIQPLFNGHDDHYADYSHGIRLVSADMVVDGQPMKLADVMRSPVLSGLVSDEGPLKQTRYPVPEVLPAGPGGGGGGLSISPNDGPRRDSLSTIGPILEDFFQAKSGWTTLLAYARAAQARRQAFFASLSNMGAAAGDDVATSPSFTDAAVYAGTVLLIGLGIGTVIGWFRGKKHGGAA